MKSIFKNLTYTFTSNLVSLLTSFFLVLFVPKFIGVESYSYWQLYIFYTTYLQFLTFGIPEGIYLEYGGHRFSELPKRKLRGQFIFLLFLTSIISIFILTNSLFFNSDVNKKIVMITAAVALILIVPRSVVTYELQATNELKTFSLIMILEKSCLMIGILLLIFFDIESFKYYIMADLFSKFLANIYLISSVENSFFGNLDKPINVIKQAVLFGKTGINITLANISSILVTGIIRLLIEINWSVVVFGQISLIVSMSNMILVFINSVSLVFFPILKRMTIESMKKLFFDIDSLLSNLSINILLIYFPIYLFLEKFLPDYSGALKYLILVFPMVIFEGKVSILYNTYLKAIRLEKKILIVNLFMIAITVLIAFPVTFILGSLDILVFLISIVSFIKMMSLKFILTSYFQSEKYQLFLSSFEVLVIFCFIAVNLILGFAVSFVLTVLFVLLFDILTFNKNKEIFFSVKQKF